MDINSNMFLNRLKIVCVQSFSDVLKFLVSQKKKKRLEKKVRKARFFLLSRNLIEYILPYKLKLREIHEIHERKYMRNDHL